MIKAVQNGFNCIFYIHQFIKQQQQEKLSLSQDNLLVSCTNFVLFGPKKVGTTSQDMLSAYDNIKDISAR